MTFGGERENGVGLEHLGSRHPLFSQIVPGGMLCIIPDRVCVI